jgi:hypothetical protein
MTNKKTHDPLAGTRGLMDELSKIQKGLEGTLDKLMNDATAALGDIPDTCTDEQVLKIKRIKKDLNTASKNHDAVGINKLITELNGFFNK